MTVLLVLAQENRAAALPEHERLETLRLLKLKWAEVNVHYQKLPFALDTEVKKRRYIHCCGTCIVDMECCSAQCA